MKAIILAILLTPLLAFSQHVGDAWGDHIFFGSAFRNTDSLKVTQYEDSLTGAADKDTLFSAMLPVTERSNGTYSLAASFDEVSGTSASIAIDVRLFFKSIFRSKDNGATYKSSGEIWGPWQRIGSVAKNTLNYYEISDSSWWSPCSGVQYRIIETDADTVIHYLRDFRN